MNDIQLILEGGKTSKFSVKSYKTNKKFIDIQDYDNSTNIFMEIQHNSMNTFLNLTSLSGHILMTFDDAGMVVRRIVCQSSVDTGQFIISTQEKSVLVVSGNNFAKVIGVVRLFLIQVISDKNRLIF